MTSEVGAPPARSMLWPMWKGRPAAAVAAGTEMGGIAGWGGRRDIYEQSAYSDIGRVRACAGVCVWTCGIGWRWEGCEAPRRCCV